MGHNDHMDDDGPELPPGAGNSDQHPFEPNDAWLKDAPPELQIEAMRRWIEPSVLAPIRSGGVNRSSEGPRHRHHLGAARPPPVRRLRLATCRDAIRHMLRRASP
jgi:hypothetical protein